MEKTVEICSPIISMVYERTRTEDLGLLLLTGTRSVRGSAVTSINGRLFDFRGLPAAGDPVHLSFGATAFASAGAIRCLAAGSATKSRAARAGAGCGVDNAEDQIGTGYQEC